VDVELVRLFQEVLEPGRRLSQPLRAQTLARLGQAMFYSGREESLHLTEEAVSEARAASQPDVTATVLSARHAVLADPDRIDERLEIAAEIVALGEGASNPELTLRGRAWRMVDRLESGDMPGFDKDLAAYAAAADSLGQPRYLFEAAAWHAMRLLFEGRFREAEERAAEARRLGDRAGERSAVMVERLQRGWIVFDRGSHDDLLDVRRRCVEDAESFHESPGFFGWETAVALIDARLGNQAEARARYETVVAPVMGMSRDAVWLHTTAMVADLCWQLGDRDGAGPLYESLLPYAGRLVVVDRGWVCRGSLDRFLGPLAGMIGLQAEAVAHCEAALRVHERFGSLPLLALSHLTYGEILRNGDDASKRAGARHLAQGRKLAQRLGMEHLASGVLPAKRAQPDRASDSGETL
jgi:hypothetical protein